LPTDDPRTTGKHTRHCAGTTDTGDVTLVGVVHDHPASIHRVQRCIDALDPDVLALELAPIAVPLFEQYARQGERTPPVFGGEMSAAIQAASCDRVVGIDGPSLPFLGRLLRSLVGDTRSVETVSAVARSLVSVSKDALLCRLAAIVTTWTGVRMEVSPPVSHDCSRTDDPETQAARERRQIRRARATLHAFEPSEASDCRARTREAHMSDRLSTLRSDGDVVAVVGISHLDAIADRLADTP